MRQHGGHAGASDEALLAIPYARFMQELRLAGEAVVESARERMREAAFIGWQVQGAFGGKGLPTFGRYLRMLGLHAPDELLPDAKRAKSNADRVREAFRQHGVRRVE